MNKIKQNKKKRNAGISFACIAILLLSSISISSQLFKSDKYTTDETMQINEIMYNPDCNDTGREWIELYNYGETIIDTTNWTFYDSGAYHEISLYSGDYEIPPNGFAVICNNAIMFLIDYPEYDGTLLVSNFSLHNNGEYIAIKNAEAEIVDDLTYEALGGAYNTNRSLEYDYNDIWAVSIAYCGTPDAPNSVWEPPMQPTEPIPADDEIDVGINPQLSVLVDDPENDTMDVYFYDASDHSLIDIDENVESGERAETQWLSLDYNTTYNWYVIANDTFFETQSETWEFTIESAPENNPPYKPSNPNPANGSIDVYFDMDLSWTGGDPDGDPVTYDVYFGNISSPPQASSNQSNTTYDPGIMDYNTTYYWKIIAWDNHSAFNESPLWEFTTEQEQNHPPYQPSNPNPANGSIDVYFDMDLSWTGGDPDGDPVTYDVYFGNISSPPQVSSNQSNTTYDPGIMDYNTTYYWKIIAWDNHSAFNESPMWEFTTESAPENNPPYEPSNPNPEDGANDVPLDTTLSWTGGDPDGDPVTYDVYFGTTSPPEQVVNNQSETTYDPELEYSQTYYWKIVAWDDSGESTEGDIWEFTTIEQQELIIEITQPEENYFYLRNMRLFGLNNKTFIYGPITIIANVTSNADIERVEFYVQGKLDRDVPVHTDYEAPYEYNWSPIISFEKTIKVIVYDTEGNDATDELVVFKWRLHPVLLMAGAAVVLNPNTKLLRSPRGYTIIRGFIFNPKHEGKTLTFRAVRLHYTKVRPLETESGVIILKKCTIKTNTPNMQLAMGPFGLFSWIFCVYKGTSLEQPRFFQAR